MNMLEGRALANASVDDLNRWTQNTAVDALGISITGLGEHSITAEMTVDHRHLQTRGFLHGGVSCVLAETVGSILSNIVAAKNGVQTVGAEINANHLRSVSDGEKITARCEFFHRGRKLHVMHILIENADQQPICVSRLTMSVLPATI